MPTVSWKNYHLLGWVITLDILETWVIFLTVLLLLLSQGLFYSTCKVIQNQTWVALFDTKVHVSFSNTACKGLQTVVWIQQLHYKEGSCEGLASKGSSLWALETWKYLLLKLGSEIHLLCSCVYFLITVRAAPAAGQLLHPEGLSRTSHQDRILWVTGAIPSSSISTTHYCKGDSSLVLWSFYFIILFGI